MSSNGTNLDRIKKEEYCLDFLWKILWKILGKIGELVAANVINYVKLHGDYVIQYKKKVQLLEQQNERLREEKEPIQRKVDIATNNGKEIKIKVSRWLEEVKQMERDIAVLLPQEEDGEQMKREFADFLRQQENGAQMEQDFAQMERDIANFMRQQENGEQMKRNFANFLRQQGESFKCFPGCMCPNLMWRHKMGKEADERNRRVIALIDRARDLPESVELSTHFQWEPHFDSSQYYTTFPSRASVFDKIMEALKDSVADMIGVHGPGGAGKTTMVKEVAKEAKKLEIFNTIVIAVVSKDPNTFKLQEDIAPQLDLKYEQKSELGRADELRKALLNGKRKILVILDDLWQELDLKAIGIPISGLGDRGCKILLTSRNEEVFNRMEVRSCFPIGYLEEQETWNLFTKVTGDFGVDESKARKVCKRCGGLPIAIVAVGAALRGKEELEWENALHQLEICPLKHIEGIRPKDYTPLKWSYDFIEEKDAKSCFLLCCLFPEDAEICIDDLVRYSFALGFLRGMKTLQQTRNRVQAMVNSLRRSCLLLNGEEENFVKMHDVIRDLAISITEEKQTEHGSGHDWPGQQQFMVDHDIRKWPRNDAWKSHTAISLKCSVGNLTFSALNCPLVHTLVLSLGNSNLEIPNDFFKGMKEARVLDLIGMELKLPSSLLELDNLRMLRINHCHFVGDLKNKNLEILSIVNSFGISTLPQDIGELFRLRSLDLRDCKILSIPKGVISKLIDLEELYVPKEVKWWDTTIDLEGMSNASITELNSLLHLRVLHVHMSTESSKIMVLGCHDLFKNLTNFAINIKDGHYLGNVSADLRTITISDSLYDQFRGFGNVLEISNIHRIDVKFHLLMDRVDDLKLEYIQDLRYLGDKPGSFCKLTNLRIVGCHGMKYLFSPSCANAFQQLKVLSVSNCDRMEQIIGLGDHYNEEEVEIDEVIIFSRLTGIELTTLPQFRCFYPGMKKATIEGNLLNSVESIFNEKVSFLMLEMLEINHLPVKYLFSSSCAKAFQQLKELDVQNCDRMEQIIGVGDHRNEEEVGVDEVIIFSQLTEMNLWSLPQFTCFCPKMKEATIEGNLLNLAESIFNEKIFFPVLERLYISDLPAKYLFSPSCAKEFQQLKELLVYYCDRMEQIIGEGDHYNEEETDEVIIFSQLREINLEALSEFRCFCPKMKKATIEENLLDSTESMFNEKVSFPVLEILIINELPMKYLLSPSCAKAFQQLKKLHVENCGRMEQIIGVGDHYNEEEVGIDEVIIFSQLTVMNLQSLPQFRCFCPIMKKATIEVNLLYSAKSIIIDEKVSFPVLEKLNINQLPVKYLFSPSCAKAFRQLKKLEVCDCDRMEQIIGGGDHFNEEEIGIDEVIIFNQLTKMTLWSLPQFRCFGPKMKKVTIEGNLLNLAESIIDEKVSFPMLKKLYIGRLPVKYLFLFSPSCAKAFQQLKELQVENCCRMEQIIGVGEHYNEEEVRIDEVIIFSRLTQMNLLFLPQFRCFCPKMKKATIEGNLSKSESIFDEKASFPMLEILNINQLPVKYLFSPSCAKAFQQLKKLHVKDCDRMEQIIGVGDHYNEEEVGIDEVIIFSRLTEMYLQSLPQFRCFCPIMKKATIEGNLLYSAESIIDEKVSFPVLEKLNIDKLPVKNIWNKETI